MPKKPALGSRFESIFDDGAGLFSEGDHNGIVTMKIGDIEPNREQPRRDFDPEQLNLLAQSITQHGVIQPLTVREHNGAYQIVAGERRWRAAKIAGLSEIPVRIMELTDSETAQIALIENLQREDLNPIEEAGGYKQLAEKYGFKQEEIAASVGKARSSIANTLRLLELPEEIKELVKQGKLSSGHCKVLLSVNDDVRRLELAHKAAKEQVSVRQLEQLAAAEAKPKRAAQRTVPAFFTEAEISLKNLTGHPVKITPKKNKITLEFSCRNEEELKELLKIIGE